MSGHICVGKIHNHLSAVLFIILIKSLWVLRAASMAITFLFILRTDVLYWFANKIVLKNSYGAIKVLILGIKPNFLLPMTLQKQ